MRVLFVPNALVVASHGVPLLALNMRSAGHSIETAFLLPRGFHGVRHNFDIDVLDIDHDGFRTEMQAYGKFRPDVVVDDCSLSTGHAAAFARIPRVTVIRTGTFPGYTPRSAAQRHSMGFNVKLGVPDVTCIGLKQPTRLDDLFTADHYIVPGIPSIEVLPEALSGRPDFTFAGPLILDDQDIEKLERVVRLSRHDFIRADSLEQFLSSVQYRPVVYFTFGNVAKADPGVTQSIERLVKDGIAVVTNIPSNIQSPLLYYSLYFPMHLVCSRVNLVVHHCGSGTYHYPLLHGVPAVTIGTGCFDRDDVALQLDRLGVAIHVDPSQDSQETASRVLDAAHRQLRMTPAQRQTFAGSCGCLRQEIERCAAAFLFPEVLERAREYAGRRPPRPLPSHARLTPALRAAAPAALPRKS
ncbi:MAG TPA: nucleotide disphospho-sugar-binding domain-containing protein [Bryobacteraceae bacterium]|jgi:hypothetical protein|nr:nucleotide disphospho-sugar-binding domain-containing protein [Bryobacteraceae bacterium]